MNQAVSGACGAKELEREQNVLRAGWRDKNSRLVSAPTCSATVDAKKSLGRFCLAGKWIR